MLYLPNSQLFFKKHRYHLEVSSDWDAILTEVTAWKSCTSISTSNSFRRSSSTSLPSRHSWSPSKFRKKFLLQFWGFHFESGLTQLRWSSSSMAFHSLSIHLLEEHLGQTHPDWTFTNTVWSDITKCGRTMCFRNIILDKMCFPISWLPHYE